MESLEQSPMQMTAVSKHLGYFEGYWISEETCCKSNFAQKLARLCAKKKSGRRPTNIKDYVDALIQGLEKHIKETTERLIAAASNRKIYRGTTKKKKKTAKTETKNQQKNTVW